MKTTKAQRERKAKNIADLRDRHRAKGRVPVQVWVRPEHREKVRELEKQLQESET